MSELPVRPTKRALDDLGLAFPVLEQRLHRLAHPVVAHAQRIPAQVAAGGAERVASLGDRVWFKVKTGRHRAAVHRLDPAYEHQPEIVTEGAWWWLGAAGTRKGDSDADDFYTRLAAECGRAGRGTGRSSSAHLLPRSVDVRRLRAELAVQVVARVRDLVCDLIARSLCDGKVWSAQMEKYEISALVRAQAGDAYLAIVAEGFIDDRILAVILDAVPGVDPDDWQTEPDGALGIQPGFGQIIRSAIIPPEYQAKIVDQYGSPD
ncbi:hypothetical protein [Catenuloplanes japonicus]|uniref:hypothetical protein n=1 Tax=Catenuloplanes japonicus TaxID=33876 RepID=UPI00052534E2|nr:hypothetical protein [Catenuloplanes japonicus]